MADSIGALKIIIGADLSKFKKDMLDAEKGLKRVFGRDSLKLANNITKGFLAVAAGMGLVAAKSIQMSGNFSLTRRAFETMLGSAEKAEVFLDDLARFAAKTPFEFVGLTKATQKILAYGFSAEQTIPLLTAIGDATAGLGSGQQGIDRITLALGQMNAKGKITGQEMRQLTDAGIKGWDMIAEAMGITVPQAMKLSEKGAINATVGITALVKGMNKQFGGMMENMAGEIPQLWSNMMDVMQLTMIDFGDQLVETFDIKERFQVLVDAVQEFSDTLKESGIKEAMEGLIDPKIQLGFATLAGIVGGAVVISLWAAAAAALAANAALLPFMLIGAALGALGFLIIRNWKPIKRFFAELFLNIQLFANVAFFKISQAFFGLAEMILAAGEKIFGWIPGVGDKLKGAREKVDELKMALTAASAEHFSKTKEKLDELKNAVDDTAKAARKLKKDLPGADAFKMPVKGTGELKDKFTELERAVQSVGKSMASTLGDIITGTADAGEALTNLGKQIARIFIDFMIKKAMMGLFPELSPQASGSATQPSATVPAFATGGIITAPMLAKVGEVPEAILPLDRLHDFIGGAGGPANVTTNIINQTGRNITAETETMQNLEGIVTNIMIKNIAKNTGGVKNMIKGIAS